MMLALDFVKCIFITVVTNLWKSENDFSIIPVLIKLCGLLVKIRSMELEFSGFLNRVVFFTGDIKP